MIETNPVIFYLVVGLAAFLVGLAKGGLGGLLGSMATPLVALVVPAEVAIGLTAAYPHDGRSLRGVVPPGEIMTDG